MIWKKRYILKLQFSVKIPCPSDHVFRIVYTFDQGHPHYEFFPCLRIFSQPSQVSKNDLVGLSDIGFVDFTVNGLHVKKNVCHCRMLCHAVKNIAVSESGSVKADAYAFLFCKSDQSFTEIRLRQHLSAGDGHSASCVIVESLVLLHVLHYLFRGHFLCYRIKRIGIADLRALHAHVALFPVYFDLAIFIHKDGILRTLFDAVSAFDAAVGQAYYSLFEIDELRIMAPSAVKRTAL